MSAWVTHIIIADKLLEKLDLDRKGFIVGNVAPDCNVENEDWTEFTPPKEVTHWMSGKSKLTADYEGFFNKYIRDNEIESREQYAFLLGYYSHLITDVEFQRFVREENRVKNLFKRIKNNTKMNEKIQGYPEDYDTIKKVFGGKNAFYDIYIQEYNYLENNTDSSYNTILRNISSFPDYIDYMPKGTIMRKIGIMANELNIQEPRKDFVFFTEYEFSDFIEETSNIIYKLICERMKEK